MPNLSLVDRMKSDGFIDKIFTPKEFIAALDILETHPFTCKSFGETLDNIFELRREFYFKFVDKNAYSKIKKDEDEVKFAAWLIFKQKNVIYTTINVLSTFCSKYDVDLEEFMFHMIRHPKYEKLYTNSWVRSAELSISDWLSHTCVLSKDVSTFKDIETLDKKQNEAIRNILSSGYSVLQGNAGCGKTRTICELVKLLVKNDVMVCAAAFTHKAKNCMYEKLQDTVVSVSTVHSLIGKLNIVKMHSMFLILDESSMLDIDLLAWLADTINAKKIKVQVCFVGDYFQIQPVGRGEFFRGLVEKDVNVNNLIKCYRTDNQDLEDNYMRLRKGEMPKTTEHCDIKVVSSDEKISEFVKSHIQANGDDYKIICWQNHHIKMINKWVQETLLKKRKIGPEVFRGFYLKDKVVFCGDNDDPLLTNATNGVVTKITPKTCTILWDTGAEKQYTKVSDIMLSYAITAHKAQGSEFSRVLVACYDVSKMKYCLDRRWLYTSFTRGKEEVILVSTSNIDSFIKQELKPKPISDISF